MKKIVIVEDEKIIAINLRVLLQQHAYQVVKSFDNAEEALPFLLTNEVDLALFDVELSGEKDGLWLAQNLKMKSDIPFIFITSFYDKATLEKANRIHPAAFIVKPFQEENLLANIELALKKVRKSVTVTASPTAASNNKVFVRDQNELIAIEKADIRYLEASDNYTFVHLPTSKLLICHTLKSMEEKLKDSGFVRIHRSYMVNFQAITHIQEGYVFVGEQKLSVGKSYKKHLMDQLTII